jgi:1-acyl-sn-glycerol-3-phosphate acyltransferase
MPAGEPTPPARTAGAQASTAQPAGAQAGTAQAGTAQAGTAQAGTAQAGTAQAVGTQAGTPQAQRPDGAGSPPGLRAGAPAGSTSDAGSGVRSAAVDVPRIGGGSDQSGGSASAATPGAAGTAGRPAAGPDMARFAAGTFGMTLTRLTARGLGRLLGRIEVTGADRVPAAGGTLLAVNHSAYIDGPLMYGVLRRPTVFLVKAEEFRGPVGAMLRRIGQIPVRRGVVERAPLQAALAMLAAGGVVAVFPEGSRGAGTVADVRHGVAYLALRSGCPVVPVACHGTRRMQQRRRPRRPRVRIAFGPPIRIAPGPASRHNVTAAAERVRAEMAAHVVATRPDSEV